MDNSAIHTPEKGQKRCRIWHTCQVTNGKKGRDLDLYLYILIEDKGFEIKRVFIDSIFVVKGGLI